MTVADELRRTLKRLVVATVVIYVVLLAVTGTTYAALCALDHDLQNRVSDSQQFLKEHPRGIAGIPASAIRVSMNSQEDTIHTLDILHCP
jgi:hypothetical protein